MSNNNLPMSQQMYFSTHNALRVNEEDDSINTLFYEMNGSRHISLLIFPFYDVQMLKRLLIKKLNLPRYIKVNDIIIIYKGIKLPNYRIISTYLDNFNVNDKKKKKRVNKLFWAIKDTNPNVSIRVVDKSKNYPPFFENMINEIKLAFNKNISPKLTMDGTGGTYLLYNGKKKVCSVFKPIDEEAFAPFNPRGYEGKMYQQGFRAGVLSGEGASREIAAYLLDNTYNNFSNVPCTVMVEACHPSFNNKSKLKYVDDNDGNTLKWKCGSLQEFVDSKESVGNYDHKQFSIRDIHKIAILDIRVMNLDRNDGNILVSPLKSLKNSCNKFLYRNKKFTDEGNDEYILKRILTIDNKPSRYSLIPIDHGLILPHIMDVAEIDLVWFEWPQTKIPFDDEELLMIFTFDPDKDAEKIRKKLLIREECIRTMRVCTRLLQIGAKMHLNLHEIAKISTRKNIDEESVLEHLVKDSIVQAYQMMDCTALMSTNRLGHILDLAEIKMNKKKKQSKMKSIETFEGKLKKKVTKEEKDIAKGKSKKKRSSSKYDSGICNIEKGNSPIIVSFKEDFESQKEKEVEKEKEMRKEIKKGSDRENENENKNKKDRGSENKNLLRNNINEKHRAENNYRTLDDNNTPLGNNENGKNTISKNDAEGMIAEDSGKKEGTIISLVVNRSKNMDNEKPKEMLFYENTNKNAQIEGSGSSEYEKLYYQNTSSQKMENGNNKNNEHSLVKSRRFSSRKCCSSSSSSSTTSSSSSSSTTSSNSSGSSSSSSSSSSDMDSDSYTSSNSEYSNSTVSSNCIGSRSGVWNKNGKNEETEQERIHALGEKGEKELKNLHISKNEETCIRSSPSLFNGLRERGKHKKKKKKKKKKKREESEKEEEEEDEEEIARTFKKKTGTMKRINENAGTAYRNIEMNKINSVWMIRDKNNNIINVKWENQNFEKLFFETFENHLIKYINGNHPNWRSYEYYGDKITCIRHSYLSSIK